MTANSEIIRAIAGKLREYKIRTVVLDPLMVSTSGRALLAQTAVSTLCKELFPLATLITPNLPEAEALTGRRLTTEADCETAAMELESRYGCAVLVKGGHASAGANRSPLRKRKNCLVLWRKGRNSKHTRYGLHAFLCNCVRTGRRPLPDGRCAPVQRRI